MEPTVVVIGGGYGGVNAAKALDEHADVVLVEPKDAFVHNVATLRALVDTEFLPRIFIPYDNLLSRGRVVHERAVEVWPDRVVVESGDELRADFVVLATGSTYPFPAKTDASATSDAIAAYRHAHDEVNRAERVLIVGAGPVGIELAGEIASAWPDKPVTLLDVATDVLGDRYRADLRDELRGQLVELGVELVLGDGLVDAPAVPAAQCAPFSVTTQSGRAVAADIWFQCYGVTPISSLLRGELASARGADGFVKVGPTLQVGDHRNVFALGDVSTADVKMAGLASRQAKVVAENILAIARGDDDLATYEPFGVAIIVPIGPEGGSGQFPGQDDLAPRELVAAVKGRDLMVDRYAEILGSVHE